MRSFWQEFAKDRAGLPSSIIHCGPIGPRSWRRAAEESRDPGPDSFPRAPQAWMLYSIVSSICTCGREGQGTSLTSNHPFLSTPPAPQGVPLFYSLSPGTQGPSSSPSPGIKERKAEAARRPLGMCRSSPLEGRGEVRTPSPESSHCSWRLCFSPRTWNLLGLQTLLSLEING